MRERSSYALLRIILIVIRAARQTVVSQPSFGARQNTPGPRAYKHRRCSYNEEATDNKRDDDASRSTTDTSIAAMSPLELL
jgi:hypothetical protein